MMPTLTAATWSRSGKVDRRLSLTRRWQAANSATQAPDLVRAPARAALGDLAGRPLVGGPRQHRVLRRHPALAGPAQERGHAVLRGHGADHLGLAELDQRGGEG